MLHTVPGVMPGGYTRSAENRRLSIIDGGANTPTSATVMRRVVAYAQRDGNIWSVVDQTRGLLDHVPAEPVDDDSTERICRVIRERLAHVGIGTESTTTAPGGRHITFFAPAIPRPMLVTQDGPVTLIEVHAAILAAEMSGCAAPVTIHRFCPPDRPGMRAVELIFGSGPAGVDAVDSWAHHLEARAAYLPERLEGGQLRRRYQLGDLTAPPGSQPQIAPGWCIAAWAVVDTLDCGVRP